MSTQMSPPTSDTPTSDTPAPDAQATQESIFALTQVRNTIVNGIFAVPVGPVAYPADFPTEQETGTPYSQIAATAYHAYFRSVHGPDYKVPDFETLDDMRKCGWECVVRQVQISLMPSQSKSPAEDWLGWVRPQDRIVNDRGTMPDGTRIV